MSYLNDLATEVFRAYEQLGGNEAIEWKKPFAVSMTKSKDFEPFAYFPGLIAALPMAFLAISFKWAKQLPSQTFDWTWLIEEPNETMSSVEPIKPVEVRSVGESMSAEPLLFKPSEKNLSLASNPFGKRVGHKVLGILGFLIGSAFSVLIFAAISLIRMPKQIWQTGIRTAAFMIHNVVGTQQHEREAIFGDLNRHFYLKALGSPGLVIGFAIAIVPTLVIGGIRAVYNIRSFPKHTFKTTMWVIRAMLNQVSSPDSSLYTRNLTDDRDYLQRFGLGILGVAIGVPIGFLMAAPIAIVRTISNTFKVISHLSKAAINIAFERRLFKGKFLDNMPENGINLKFGVLGIPLGAGAMAGILATVLFFRYVVPTIANLFFMPLSILRRMAGESYKLATNKQLLSNQGALKNKDFDTIKLIMANKSWLNGRPDPKLPLIPREGVGSSEIGGSFFQNLFTPRNWAKFLRKVVTRNTQGLEEKFLSKVVKKLSEADAIAVAHLCDKRNLLQQEVVELKATKEQIKVEISSINSGTSGVRKKLKLPILNYKLENTHDSIKGISNEIDLISGEIDTRTSGNECRNTELIDVTVKEMKRSYRFESAFTMSRVEKESNDGTLDLLAKFLKHTLSCNRIEEDEEFPPPPYNEDEPLYVPLPNFMFSSQRTPSAPPAYASNEQKDDSCSSEAPMRK
ncbi:MAG: hypothetical protein H0U75_04130 [Legionella sp.]|nr:hypothetical protein [Legionella sp.]